MGREGDAVPGPQGGERNSAIPSPRLTQPPQKAPTLTPKGAHRVRPRPRCPLLMPVVAQLNQHRALGTALCLPGVLVGVVFPDLSPCLAFSQ